MPKKRRKKWSCVAPWIGRGCLGALLAVFGATAWAALGATPPPAATGRPAPAEVSLFLPEAKPAPRTHPKHILKVWTARYKGRVFRVTQLPRCEHIEAVLAHNPRGETKQQAKGRLGGAAACTGSFHNPKSMSLADFLQDKGDIVAHARTGRWFLAVRENGELDISDNYVLVKGRSGISAIALGQRLVPLHRDGFSARFMNRVTDRMALGLGKNYIFIVQGKSDLWRLADFISRKLPVKVALNADGGHVVRGRSPVHIVFRWRKASLDSQVAKIPNGRPAR